MNSGQMRLQVDTLNNCDDYLEKRRSLGKASRPDGLCAPNKKYAFSLQVRYLSFKMFLESHHRFFQKAP